MKIIKPDKEVIRIIEAILAQNTQIIATNAALLQVLASPVVVFDETIKAGKPGEILHMSQKR